MYRNILLKIISHDYLFDVVLLAHVANPESKTLEEVRSVCVSCTAFFSIKQYIDWASNFFIIKIFYILKYKYLCSTNLLYRSLFRIRATNNRRIAFALAYYQLAIDFFFFLLGGIPTRISPLM